MTRVALVRTGYALVGLGLLTMGGQAVGVGALLFLGVALAFLGGLVLAFSQDELPKWAGIVLLAYFVLTLAAFLLATPFTINRGGDRFFVNDSPPAFADDLVIYFVLAFPIMVAASALVGAWEREHVPRLLLAGAVGGFALVAVVGVALSPAGADEETIAASLALQDILQRSLLALAAVCGAAGAAWVAARPEEFS